MAPSRDTDRKAEHEEYAKQQCSRLIAEAAELRAANYLSQQDVCKALGLSSHANLSEIERHQVVPNLEKFLRILSVYGYTLVIKKK